MKKVVFFIVTLLLLLSAKSSYAGRPLSTDDAGTVEPGHLEAEVGWEFAKESNDDKENSIAVALTAGIIWDRLDFGFEIPYLWLNPDEGDSKNGIGDVEARFKLRFVDESDDFPALAITCGIKTETGDSDKGLGSGEVDYALNGIISKSFEKSALHVNVGYTFVGEPEGEDLDNVFNYSGALEYAATEKLNLVCELAGETTFEDDFDDHPFSTLLGLNYALNNIAVFDAGVGIGISKASPDYTLTTGLTLGF